MWNLHCLLTLQLAFSVLGLTEILWDGSTDGQPYFDLSWEVDTEAGEITFAVNIQAVDRWFSVGVSDSGAMKGADLAVFAPQASDDEQPITLTDMWSVDYVHPIKDTVQDLRLLDAVVDREAGETKVVWSRTLNSCDKDQDLDILDADTSIIFAIGSSPTLQYHGSARGLITFNLFEGDLSAEKEAKVPDDVLVYTLKPERASNIVEGKRTQYSCVVMEFPQLDADHHVLKKEPLIETGFAHHMISMTCNSLPTMYEGKAITVGERFDCGLMFPPECNNNLGGWAVGGRTEYFVDDYAPLVGTSARYVFLQTHLDNPNYNSGADNSGLRFHLSKQLRPYSLQTSVTGVRSTNIVLPPGDPSLVLSTECPESCTLGVQPSTIVSVNFHMHEKGEYIYLEHWRNNTRLPDVHSQHWDFSFQGARQLPNGGVSFLPGDELRLRCVYNTENENEPIYGGDGTNNEMCLAILSVYPPNNLRMCMKMDKELEMLGLSPNEGDENQNATMCVTEGTGGGLFGSGIFGGLDLDRFSSNPGQVSIPPFMKAMLKQRVVRYYQASPVEAPDAGRACDPSRTISNEDVGDDEDVLESTYNDEEDIEINLNHTNVDGDTFLDLDVEMEDTFTSGTAPSSNTSTFFLYFSSLYFLFLYMFET